MTALPLAAHLATTGDEDTHDWTQGALCAQIGDPDLWYPDKGGQTLDARALCRQCPVQQPCLEAALATDATWGTYGTWAGYTAHQRKQMRTA